MDEKTRLRLPFPDPMGILERLTQGLPVQLFDPGVSSSKPDSDDYVDDKINKYRHHIIEAYKNSPCSGCRGIMESAIVGLEIYQYMINNNKSRDEVPAEVIEKIKIATKQKYNL